MNAKTLGKVLLALLLFGWAGYNLHRFFSPPHAARTRDAETLNFRCAKCGATFAVAADALGAAYRDAPPGTPGGRAHCPKCGGQFSATLAPPAAPAGEGRRGS